MGMYTQIYFNAVVPDSVAQTIRNFAEHGDPGYEEHNFFSLPRARHIFDGGDSYHAGGIPLQIASKWLHDPERKTVLFVSSIKNYDGEIEQFFDWVSPLVTGGDGSYNEHDGEFIGYSLHEEDSVPRLYYSDGTRRTP